MSKVKRGVSITVIITATIAALLIIAVAVLNFVRVNPMRAIATDDKVKSYEFYDTSATAPFGTTANTNGRIRSALNTMDFSVMQAILEWKWNYNYYFEKTKDEDDKTVRVEMTPSQVRAVTPSDSQYMIVLHYEPATVKDNAIDTTNLQSFTLEGSTVYYDTLILLINSSDTKVGLMRIIPYISFRMDNEAEGNEELSPDYYTINPILVRAYSEKCAVVLKEVADSLNGITE